MPKMDLESAKLKAEQLVEQATALTARIDELAAALSEAVYAQTQRLTEIQNRTVAIDQAERLTDIKARMVEVTSTAGEIARLLAGLSEPVKPPVEPPPPPPVEPPPPPVKPPSGKVDLFLNPYNKDSAHHTQVGTGASYGIAPGTLKAQVANPSYDQGQRGSRGRLEKVKTFRCGASKQGQKYLRRVQPSDPEQHCVHHGGAGSGSGLPCTLRMPPASRGNYPTGSGDNSVMFYPHNGDPKSDVIDILNQFHWDSNGVTARARHTHPLSGRDVRNRYNDSGSWGPGAIDWRHPGGFLRGHEVDLTGKHAIPHLLNATATRHSGAGAKPEHHVLSKRMCYPAWNTDRPLSPDENLGDIPYGTIIVVRWQDRGLRETLGLSPLGRVLFDTFLHFGCCLCDGQGQTVGGAPVLQLRVDSELAEDNNKVSAVDAALGKILPHLWPIWNPRRHNEDDQRHNGLIYVGGGEPLGGDALNNAWDA